MIMMANDRLYQSPVIFMKAPAKPFSLSEFEKPAIVIGTNISACAKIIGITPAAFTLSGMYWRTPPYCLLPTIRLAYCTGIRRSPRSTKTIKATTPIIIARMMMTWMAFHVLVKVFIVPSRFECFQMIICLQENLKIYRQTEF